MASAARQRQYSFARGGVVATIAAIAFLLSLRAGTLFAALAAAVAAFVSYGLLNAPVRYRRHGWGQVREAVDNWMGIFGRDYPQDLIERDAEQVGRNDPCPCGSNKKFKHCCGGQA